MGETGGKYGFKGRHLVYLEIYLVNIQEQINKVQDLNSPFNTLLTNRAEVKFYDVEQFRQRPYSIM